MKIAIGSDEKTTLTDYVVEELRRRGHDVKAYGPMAGEQMGWPYVGGRIAVESVTAGPIRESYFAGRELELQWRQTRSSGFERNSVGTLRPQEEHDSGAMQTFLQ